MEAVGMMGERELLDAAICVGQALSNQIRTKDYLEATTLQHKGTNIDPRNAVEHPLYRAVVAHRMAQEDVDKEVRLFAQAWLRYATLNNIS